MHVTVTFRHMESSDAVRAYAEEKSERLAKYVLEPAELHWVLSVEKIRHIAEVILSENGAVLKAQEATQDMYSAIDAVIDKLIKQVKKYKEKVREHKVPLVTQQRRQAVSAATAETETGAGPTLAIREEIDVKPMSLEEAMMQLEALGEDFLVFTDSVTGNTGILYRMKDGNYGLKEMRAG